MSASGHRLLVALALACLLGGCGKASSRSSAPYAGSAASVPARRGIVSTVTKNTTRLGGAEPVVDAAAVAGAVYPGLTPASRPRAVVLVDQRNWPAALAASALAGAPLGAPLLFADGNSLPAASAQALAAMHPRGAPTLGGAAVIRIATAAPLAGGYGTLTVPAGPDPASTAAAVERLFVRAQAQRPSQVIVVDGAASEALQMPAAALAAESATPILPTTPAGVPPATAAALRGLGRPTIYLLGAPALGARALGALARFGRVVPIAGTGAPGAPAAAETADPVQNAIAVARFAEGSFGWGVHEAGHGLAFALASRSLDAPAAAPLAAHGDYAPLLLLTSSTSLPAPLARYLSNIEPGYTAAIRPVRGVYNHGWLIGDESAISAQVQAELDALLEIAPRKSSEEPSVASSE